MGSRYQDEPYSNKFQRQLVEYLHTFKKVTAVDAASNSTVEAYLTRQSVSAFAPELGPYEIDRVHPLPDSEPFSCKVRFTAQWSEVDMEDDDLVADWMVEDGAGGDEDE